MDADRIAARAVVSVVPIRFQVGMHGFVGEALTIRLVKAILL
jgi:hypothetical protein